jgi:cytochrome c oxidase cbb3-type subunit 3
MNNIKKYTKGFLSLLLIFFITNSSFAATTETSGVASNKTMFYMFLVLALLLILAIFFLSNAIKNLLGSEFYKEKVYDAEKKKRENNINKIVTLLLILGLPFASFSLSPATNNVVASSNDMSIEWVWAMIFANVILVGVLFYLRGLFLQLLYSVRPKKVVVKKAKKSKQASKLTQMLTDIVPLENEDDILTDHDYDGIQELDNNLPPWWLWSFYASVIFAVIYIFNYHVFKTADLQIAEYENDIVQKDAEVAAYLKSMKLNVDESSVILLTEQSDINTGKKIFDQKCVACHGKSGEGVIGPNLTDDYWIKGGSIKDVFKTIKYGTDKGMQSWKDELNPVQIQQVSSFIKSIRGTVAEGKEAQGDLYKEEDSSTEETIVTDSTVAVVDSI